MEEENNRKKTLHEKLDEVAMEEEGMETEKSASIRKETKDEMEEEAEVEHQLGEKSGHMEDDLQGEEEE